MPARKALQHRFSAYLSISIGLCFKFTAFSNVLFAHTYFKAFHCLVSNVLLLEVFLVRNDIPVMLLLRTTDVIGKSDDIT